MQLLFQAIHCLAEETFHGNFDKELKQRVSSTYSMISNGNLENYWLHFFMANIKNHKIISFRFQV